MKRLKADKKGRAKLTVGRAVLRVDFGKLWRVLTGGADAGAMEKAAEMGEKLRREGEK